jgi:predicted nucleotidyltransferase
VRDELLRFATFLERPEYESGKPTGAADGKASVGRASARQDQRRLDPSIRGLTEELAAGLAEIYGDRLRGVYLFGSRARGDAGPDSDVDVLVVLDQVANYGAEIERTGQLVADVSLKYGVSVSRVFTSEQDWVEGRGPFLARLRMEAVPIVPVDCR